MAAFKDYTGQVLNGMTWLRPTGRMLGTNAAWEVQCHCGIVFVMRGKSQQRSCGCQSLRHKNYVNKNGLRQGYNTFIGNHPYANPLLSYDEFCEKAILRCSYCDREPENIQRNGRKYQGLDRVVNCDDCSIGNLVPCCGDCNSKKGAHPLDKFRDDILRMAVVMFTASELENAAYMYEEELRQREYADDGDL